MNKQILIIAGLILALAFGFYLANSYMEKQKEDPIEQGVVDQMNLQKVDLKIDGMTCDGCANSIEKAVTAQEGVVSANASFEDGNAIIEFDRTLVNTELIESIIGEAGYQVIGLN